MFILFEKGNSLKYFFSHSIRCDAMRCDSIRSSFFIFILFYFFFERKDRHTDLDRARLSLTVPKPALVISSMSMRLFVSHLVSCSAKRYFFDSIQFDSNRISFPFLFLFFKKKKRKKNDDCSAAFVLFCYIHF